MQPQIRLLGGYGLCAADGTPIRLPTRKSWALLAYLVQSGGRNVQREELAALLWPHSGEDQARASLRQELAVLKKALHTAATGRYEAGKDIVRFDDQDTSDTRRMESLVASGRTEDLRVAGTLYPGERFTLAGCLGIIISLPLTETSRFRPAG